jgi:hypothetical protein
MNTMAINGNTRVGKFVGVERNGTTPLEIAWHNKFTM